MDVDLAVRDNLRDAYMYSLTVSQLSASRCRSCIGASSS